MPVSHGVSRREATEAQESTGWNSQRREVLDESH
jgi:hypothetical protein